jgi:hypothetical protein
VSLVGGSRSLGDVLLKGISCPWLPPPLPVHQGEKLSPTPAPSMMLCLAIEPETVKSSGHELSQKKSLLL